MWTWYSTQSAILAMLDTPHTEYGEPSTTRTASGEQPPIHTVYVEMFAGIIFAEILLNSKKCTKLFAVLICYPLQDFDIYGSCYVLLISYQ